MLRIIRELIEFHPKSKQTNIAEALKFLSSVMKKKAIVFLLSDFISEDYQRTIKIVSRKHDVTGIRIYDKREESIPNLGMVQMQDEETGELLLVNTASKKVRKEYNAYYRQRVNTFKEAFQKSGVTGLKLSRRVTSS